jgi:hypothetical protein
MIVCAVVRGGCEIVKVQGLEQGLVGWKNSMPFVGGWLYSCYVTRGCREAIA